MRWIFGLVAGAMMATAAAGEDYKGNEMPPYRVEVAEGAFEVRSYGAHVVAEVTVDGSREASVGTGFRVLAGYIFGGNAAGAKIAMTVPVAQSAADAAGAWTVRFLMPSANAAAGLPQPTDGRIRFVTMPPERQVALRFSGVRSDKTLAEKALSLKDWAAARGLTVTAGPHYYFYDGPMTLPWNRRNEVAFSIK